MIRISELSLRYGPLKALSNVSLEIPSHQILGLLGQNGAGKTSLLNILSGFLRPGSGKVEIKGHSVVDEPIAAKALIGYLPEHPPLYHELTVWESLQFCAELKRVEPNLRAKHIDRICQLTGLEGQLRRRAGNLSKGYQQRLGLAQALCGGPEILLMDEPSSGFDPRQASEFRQIVKQLSEEHTIVFSSHLLSEVQQVCDRIVILEQGRVIYDQPVSPYNSATFRRIRLRLLSREPDLLTALRSLPGVRSLSVQPGELQATEVIMETEAGAQIERALMYLLSGLQVPIAYMAPLEDSIEDIFLRLTSALPAAEG